MVQLAAQVRSLELDRKRAPARLACRRTTGRAAAPTSARHVGRSNWPRFDDRLGQCGNRRRVEEALQRDVGHGVANPDHRLRREQRVAAEGEEVIVHTDALDAEQLLPNTCDLLLERRAWCDEFDRTLHLAG